MSESPSESVADTTCDISPRAILWIVGFSVFVAADDLTVVSTMLRPIVSDLGLVMPDGLDDAAWIVNAYLIAFIATYPRWTALPGDRAAPTGLRSTARSTAVGRQVP